MIWMLIRSMHTHNYWKYGNKGATGFVRFVTGSSSLIEQRMQVQFNCLTGAARWPIAHSCSSVLELSVNCTNYSDFEADFVRFGRVHHHHHNYNVPFCACVGHVVHSSVLSRHYWHIHNFVLFMCIQ